MPQKGFSKILMVIIGIAAIAVGYLAWQYLEYRFPPVIKGPEGGISPGKPLADETANWKTYRNEEYGFPFSVNYPQDWVLEVAHGYCNIGNCLMGLHIKSKKEEIKITESSKPDIWREVFIEDGTLLDIEVGEIALHLPSIGDWRPKDLEHIKVMEFGNFQTKAYRAIYRQSMVIEFVERERFCRISCNSASQERFEKDKSVCEQILSTFRFLE